LGLECHVGKAREPADERDKHVIESAIGVRLRPRRSRGCPRRATTTNVSSNRCVTV
jgi:hypothetical protein